MYISQLQNGPPADSAFRTDRETSCYAFLDEAGVKYQRLDHDRADTMEVCREIDLRLDAVICKNLVLCNRQKTDFYLLLIPDDKVFKTKDLSAQIGSARLSFASAEDMESLLGVSPGSASVLALKNDHANRVRLLIDREVLESESFGCHPCVNTSSLRFSVKDLTEKVIPATGHKPTFVVLPRYTGEDA